MLLVTVVLGAVEVANVLEVDADVDVGVDDVEAGDGDEVDGGAVDDDKVDEVDGAGELAGVELAGGELVGAGGDDVPTEARAAGTSAA